MVSHFLKKYLHAFGYGKHLLHGTETVLAVCGIIAEGERFFDIDDGVNAETRNAFVQPPVDHL